MKYFVIVLFLFLGNILVNAQIPYFSGTAGKDNLYGYTSVKFRPTVNSQESYTTFQYGISDHTALGTDIYSFNNSVYFGFTLRGGYIFNQRYGIGLQYTPSFDMSNSFKYSYSTIGLYQNGAISQDGKLFWVSNTWCGLNRNSKDTWNQWWYLGYYFDLDKKRGLTPMVGCLHDWEFKNDADLALGIYYSYNNWNFYIWSNDYLNHKPRVVIGFDFKLNTNK